VRSRRCRTRSIAAHLDIASEPRPDQGFPRALVCFDTTPGFAVNVTRSELEALAADPRVLRIQEDRLSAPLSSRGDDKPS
jgi:hypothetical protein